MADPCFDYSFDPPPNPDPFFDADGLLAGDLPFSPPLDADFPPDLVFSDDFNIDVDFSIDDFFLRSPEHGGHSPVDAANNSFAGPSGASSNSSPYSPEHGGHFPVDAANNSSTDRGIPHPSPCSPESGNSSVASGVVDLESKGDENKSWSLKRKKGVKEEGEDTRVGGNSVANANPKSSKSRRSEEVSSPSCVFSSEANDDGKRKARLMRNRESAQLSRQRKKQHVEELEEKVRSMHSTINELNAKISYVMAENATLRQQLGASGGVGVPPTVYPPPLPGAIAPMHFPWIPGCALRSQGSQVPLVPIPRLKTQQSAPAPKVKKSESKKGENKTKKVASVSLLGLFFIMLFFGGVIPGVNLWYGGNGNDIVAAKGRISSNSKGRILSVTGRGSGLDTKNEIGVCNGKDGSDRVTGKKCQSGNYSWSPTGSNGSAFKQNPTETLPALLYVPRNGKHVKINGNLIIHSVLASEKAMKEETIKQSSTKEDTSLAITGNRMPSALVLSQTGRETDQHSKSYRIGSDRDDGSLQQWFREGMTGPILSSGMCTEVFQFDASPSSAYLGSVVPATANMNATTISNGSENLPPTSGNTGEKKNRRMLYLQPIPLPGATASKTDQFMNSSQNNNFHNTKPTSPMVVSVLADPREVGDGDNDGRVSSKSMPRIFVVVLLDSVKYVTYSCILPFKNSAPIL